MNINNTIVSAISKYIRISPSKIQLILCKIKGKSYEDTLKICKVLPKKTGTVVWKTLHSAISNAVHNFNLKKDTLFIKEAFVNKGSILKRVRFRARGRTFSIQKQMSHVTIRVSAH